MSKIQNATSSAICSISILKIDERSNKRMNVGTKKTVEERKRKEEQSRRQGIPKIYVLVGFPRGPDRRGGGGHPLLEICAWADRLYRPGTARTLSTALHPREIFPVVFVSPAPATCRACVFLHLSPAHNSPAPSNQRV